VKNAQGGSVWVQARDTANVGALHGEPVVADVERAGDPVAEDVAGPRRG
jgi:hypothetical protein